ncbi:MAG TPA: glycosyl hydrolase family 28-related protein, partial [Acidimicrobiales bacterium]|nr:glycosyl hydrolase family 28-related protein [Acidimicrobiales bacterium]
EREVGFIRWARRNGTTWTEIATALGTTRQGAWDRWHELDGEVFGSEWTSDRGNIMAEVRLDRPEPNAGQSHPTGSDIQAKKVWRREVGLAHQVVERRRARMPGESPFFNVKDAPFNAVGDGTADDAGAIRNAIEAAAPLTKDASGKDVYVNPSGSTVYFPAGNYLVKSSLTVPDGVILQGVGWNTPGYNDPCLGSWIFVASDADFSPVAISGSSGSVRDLAFNVVDQVVMGPPANCKPMIYVTGANALIENVFLYNPYFGISVYETARTVIRRVFGQPLQCGIRIDYSFDTNYIDAIHFWSYWATSSKKNPVTAAWTYQRENATAIALFRCDNPHISNVFASNYKTGLSLAVSQWGNPHKVHLLNADFDDCMTGIHIACPLPDGSKSDQVAIQMSNVTVQAPTGASEGSYGLWIEEGPTSTIVQASNVRFTDSGANAVLVEAENVSFYGENVCIESWGAKSVGFLIKPTNSEAYLGLGCSYFPLSAPQPYSPFGQFWIPTRANPT